MLRTMKEKRDSTKKVREFKRCTIDLEDVLFVDDRCKGAMRGC